MWIILLDHSGSMGQPFDAVIDGTTRRTRQADAEIKLAAAKEVLLEELGQLGSDVPIAIFGFTRTASLVFEGQAGQTGAIRSSLELLVAGGGTDIASALNKAVEYAPSRGKGELMRIVLISDGQSDRTRATRAARSCLEIAMGIHFILIDPTDEGKAFAREVVGSVGGTSFTVTSRTQLQTSARQAGIAYQRDQARAEAYLNLANDQATTIRAETASREHVEFTAGYPNRMRPNCSYSLRVWVHLERMRNEVEGRLRDFETSLNEKPRSSQSESNVQIPLGTQLTIVPNIRGLFSNPSRQEITWFGELEEVTFTIERTSTLHSPCTYAGFIDVAVSGHLIAQIPVSISAGNDEQEFAWERSNAKMISRVFASYAREDLPIVHGCKAAYKGLGIHLFVDKDDILAGQSWKAIIRRSIGNHDLFQLFWSQQAADSSEVANEWKLAIAIASQRSEGFIRPVYWTEPMAPPPHELAMLNFAFLDVKTLNIEPVDASSGEAAPLNQIEAKFPVIDVAGSAQTHIDTLRHDIARIVPFLENLIEARYYPPVSFVVDSHTVMTTHKALDSSDLDEVDAGGSPDDTKHTTSLLQSLALAFHVGQLVPEVIRYTEREPFFNISNGQSKAEFDHVVQMAEWVFLGPVREYFGGQDVFSAAFQSMRSCLETIAMGDIRHTHNVKWMIQRLLELGSQEDNELVKDIVTNDLLEALGSFETSKYVEAARRLLDSPISKMADKYQVCVFFHRPIPTELRLCKSFPEYVAKLCARWLSYIDISLLKQGDVNVDIGYSAPQSSIQWLAVKLPTVNIRRKKEERNFGTDEPSVQYELGLNDYRKTVEVLSDLLVRQLNQRENFIGCNLLPVAASTYGVYIPASASSGQNQFEQTLTKHGWPLQAGLAGQGKVLVCNDAIDNIRRDLAKLGLDDASATDLSNRIALSVLVHEHFHGAVATATGREGRLPLGSLRWNDWEQASAMNEALAAWAERHFFRKDPEMTLHINAYIHKGEYPTWPYRGADFLEEIHRKGGVPSVRGWIKYLQDDPVNAQIEFDVQYGAFKGLPNMDSSN
jgi:hypothetical protein